MCQHCEHLKLIDEKIESLLLSVNYLTHKLEEATKPCENPFGAQTSTDDPRR